MRVLGFEVTPEVEAAVLSRMQQDRFQSLHLADVAHSQEHLRCFCALNKLDNGRRWEIAHRISDRLIQRERSRGNIRMYTRPYWCWLTEEER